MLKKATILTLFLFLLLAPSSLCSQAERVKSHWLSMVSLDNGMIELAFISSIFEPYKDYYSHIEFNIESGEVERVWIDNLIPVLKVDGFVIYNDMQPLSVAVKEYLLDERPTVRLVTADGRFLEKVSLEGGIRSKNVLDVFLSQGRASKPGELALYKADKTESGIEITRLSFILEPPDFPLESYIYHDQDQGLHYVSYGHYDLGDDGWADFDSMVFTLCIYKEDTGETELIPLDKFQPIVISQGILYGFRYQNPVAEISEVPYVLLTPVEDLSDVTEHEVPLHDDELFQGVYPITEGLLLIITNQRVFGWDTKKAGITYTLDYKGIFITELERIGALHVSSSQSADS